MLRACRRVLRPRGRTAFFTIHPAPGLTGLARRRANRDGPVAVASCRAYRDLLARAGFVEIDDHDRTGEMRRVTRSWIDRFDAHRDELVEVLGQAAHAEAQRRRRAQLRAVDDGVLRRSLFVARAPG